SAAAPPGAIGPTTGAGACCISASSEAMPARTTMPTASDIQNHGDFFATAGGGKAAGAMGGAGGTGEGGAGRTGSGARGGGAGGVAAPPSSPPRGAPTLRATASQNWSNSIDDS